MAAGAKVRPYFRHLGDHPSCRLLDPAAYERSTAHLQYQLAFRDWLTRYGHHPVLEKRLEPTARRCDVHVMLAQASASLEIQLSPTDAHLTADDVPLAQVDRVLAALAHHGLITRHHLHGVPRWDSTPTRNSRQATPAPSDATLPATTNIPGSQSTP